MWESISFPQSELQFLKQLVEPMAEKKGSGLGERLANKTGLRLEMTKDSSSVKMKGYGLATPKVQRSEYMTVNLLGLPMGHYLGCKSEKPKAWRMDSC